MSSLKNILMVRWLCLFVVCTMASPLLHAAPPTWWAARGVLDTNKQANDYAAVNQGQLKNIAQQALVAMDASFNTLGLPVDTTDVLHTTVSGWSQPDGTRNDYQAVNLGQVKHMAQMFYDRFRAVNYTDRYPWTGLESLSNDYATANVGQVKNLFSFDFTQPGAGLDLDQNGLPDYWEMKYFGHTGVDPNAPLAWNNALTNLQAYQQGLNPNDFYNGHAPTLAYVSGDNQMGLPGALVPAPLIVSVAINGQALANAPVVFTITVGGGKFKTSSTGVFVDAITVLTDWNGQAKAFYQLPPGVLNGTNTIKAAPVGGGYTVSVPYTEKSDGGGGSDGQGGSYGSPFDPTNVTATLNSDGSMDVAWTSNADPNDQTLINIQDFDANGVYSTIATAPAGATSYHIKAPTKP